MKKIILLLSSLLLCFTFSREAKQRSKNWISVSYLKCLENQLPCACQAKEKHTFIRLDTIRHDVVVSDGVIYDPNMYSLKNKGRSFYEAYTTRYIEETFKDTVIVRGTFQLEGDTLMYTGSDQSKDVYVNFGKPNADEYAYDKEQVKWMNNAFAARGYPSLQKILHSDSLRCGCHAELGHLNFVQAGKQWWILEQDRQNVSIYEWINVPEDKPIDLDIEKKLVQRFKW